MCQRADGHLSLFEGKLSCDISGSSEVIVGQPDIRIDRGAQAWQLLADPAFLSQWAALCDRCPWATSFQRPEFAATWYRVYADSIEPILVSSRAEDGCLSGLLCLAMSLGERRLFAAGDVQAEYQVWVSEADQGDAFALSALSATRAAFAPLSLSLRYLPPSTPLDWLGQRTAGLRCVLSRKPRPLLRFADRSLDSLSKINNRKRLKHLKKLGEPILSRLNTVEDLKQSLDELAIFYDFRLGAMYGYEPFSRDPLRKTLQLELMKQPNLLHATELKVGGRRASVHVNIRDRNQVHMNLMGYSPLMAKHSPGKFHIHMLSRMLEEEGYEALDLTPGGDPYKERFANAHDTAFVLSVHPGWWSQARGHIHGRVDSLLRRLAKRWELHPARVRHAREWLKHYGLWGLTRALGERVSSCRVTWLFSKDAACNCGRSRDDDPPFQRDAIEELLRYRPIVGGVPRRRFLFDALTRLEHGQHVYTCVRAGRLAYVGWVMDHPSEAFVARALPGVPLPTDRRLILGMQMTSDEPDEELGGACLRAMLKDPLSEREDEAVTAVVPDGDLAVRHLEEAGFSQQGTLVTRVVCGRVRHVWQEPWPKRVDQTCTLATASTHEAK